MPMKLNPIQLLSTLYMATEEQAAAVWDAFENTTIGRNPTERMDACVVCLMLQSVTAFKPEQIAAILAKELPRSSPRHLVNDIKPYRIGQQLIGLAQFHGLNLTSIFADRRKP